MQKLTLEEIQSELSNYTIPIVKRMAKIQIINDESKRKHWIHKIYEFVHEVPQVSTTNEFPTAAQIEESLFPDNVRLDLFETIVDYLKDYGKQEDENLREYTLVDLNILLNICKKYINLLSEQLGSKGYVSEEWVEDTINMLFTVLY